MICGRGAKVTHHIGNRRLRVLVEVNLGKYSTSNKIIKGTIVSQICETIREAASQGGGSVKQSASGMWVEVGDSVAREKVGQTFRELLAKRNPAKLQKRKERRKQIRAKRAQTSNVSSSSTPASSKESCSASIVSCEVEPTACPSLQHPEHRFDAIDLDNSMKEIDSL